LDATARLARSIASLFNPILYPESTAHLEITQEEIGALSGMSRPNANRALNRLGKEGLLRLEYGGVPILDIERLRLRGFVKRSPRQRTNNFSWQTGRPFTSACRNRSSAFTEVQGDLALAWLFAWSVA
jgi:hypothetical protein